MAANTLHAVHVLAARNLLGAWALAGCEAVILHGGMLHPIAKTEPGAWCVASEEAFTVLVATVHAGARYQGWQRAVEAAEKEVRT